ncbi:hypothetical protein ACWEK5_44880, partial [Rhodococcus koreensis]
MPVEVRLRWDRESCIDRGCDGLVVPAERGARGFCLGGIGELTPGRGRFGDLDSSRLLHQWIETALFDERQQLRSGRLRRGNPACIVYLGHCGGRGTLRNLAVRGGRGCVNVTGVANCCNARLPGIIGRSPRDVDTYSYAAVASVADRRSNSTGQIWP